MLSESERLEFDELLRGAELTVTPEDLPAMETQYLLLKRYRAVVEVVAADLGEMEPGFRFDAQWASQT